MGAGSGPDFGNTAGSQRNEENQASGDMETAHNNVKLPPDDSQTRHIFSNKEGHVSDTVENRREITRVANTSQNYFGKDKYGNKWYAETKSDGSQIWVKVHGRIISDAGRNMTPREWDKETGFNYNPKKNSQWRKRK